MTDLGEFIFVGVVAIISFGVGVILSYYNIVWLLGARLREMKGLREENRKNEEYDSQLVSKLKVIIKKEV
jgi:hypothetical protein